MNDLVDVRCQGWYRNGPCNFLVFKGNIENGYVNIKCDKCHNIVHVGKGIVFTTMMQNQIDINSQYIINL